MNRDIFEAALMSTIPESAFPAVIPHTNGRPRAIDSPKEPYQAKLDSGTTVLAFHFKDGIVFSADRQTSSQFSIVSQESVKINRVSPHSAYMFAGSVGDGQMVVESLRRVFRDFIGKFGMPLSLEGQANYLSRFLRTYYNYGIYIQAWGIIAGLDLSTSEFKIYSVAPEGSKISSDFATTGSGGDRAENELERSRGRIKAGTIEMEEALGLAVKAVYAAGKKDMGTSDVRLALPLVATITVGGGFEFVSSAKVVEVRDKLIAEEKRNGNVA